VVVPLLHRPLIGTYIDVLKPRAPGPSNSAPMLVASPRLERPDARLVVSEDRPVPASKPNGTPIAVLRPLRRITCPTSQAGESFGSG
jgi:hypothetical protein